MIAKNLEVHYTADGYPIVSVQLTAKVNLDFKKDDLLDVTIKKHRKKRSLTANSYLWVLLDKLADKLNTTKVELYREAIKQVGKFEFIPVRLDAVESFISAWQGQGLGNIAERFRESTMDGYEVIQVYFGSSSLDSKEMARLIDYVVEECKVQGIETMSDEELERLINEKAK